MNVLSLKILAVVALVAGSASLASGAFVQDAKPAKPPAGQEQAPADPFYRAAKVRFSVLQYETVNGTPRADNQASGPVQVPARTIDTVQLVDCEQSGMWLEIRFRNGDYSLQKITTVNFIRTLNGTGDEVLVARAHKSAMFFPFVN